MPSSGDPWDWDVEKVIEELSTRANVDIANTFRQNEVSGRTLLTVLDFKALKEDLEIIPFGQRERLMFEVKRLQRTSKKYGEYILEAASSVQLPIETEPLDGLAKQIMPMHIPVSKAAPQRAPIPVTVNFTMCSVPHETDAFMSHHTEAHEKRPLNLLVRAEGKGPFFVRFGERGNQEIYDPVSQIWDNSDGEASSGSAGVAWGSSAPSSQQEAEPSLTDMNNEVRVESPTPLSPVMKDSTERATTIRDPPNGQETQPPAASQTTLSSSPTIDCQLQSPVIVNGRKRAVLIPVASGMAMPLSPAVPEPSSSDLAVNMDELEPSLNVEKRKRAVLIPVPQDSGEGLSLSGDEAAEEIFEDALEQMRDDLSPIDVQHREPCGGRQLQFLPARALTVDDLFYLGRNFDDDLESEDDNFLISTTDHPPGTRQYVSKQMYYFLSRRQEASEIYQGHFRMAIKPYKESLLRKHQEQSITMFEVGADDLCKVYKTTCDQVNTPFGDESTSERPYNSGSQIVRFGFDPQGQSLSQTNPNTDDWDYLLKWRNVSEDRELPPFGESDDDNEYDLATWKEIEEEEGVKLPKQPSKHIPRTLSSEEVDGTMEDVIETLVKAWRLKVLPQIEHTAFDRWKRAKQQRTRKKTIANAQALAGDMNGRLNNLKKEMKTLKWGGEAELRRVCRSSFELTVYNREKQLWIISIIESKAAPEGIPRPKKLKAAQLQKEGLTPDSNSQMGSFDEEGIGSEDSELDYSDDEEMENFVVPDSVRDIDEDGKAMTIDGEDEIFAELVAEEEGRGISEDSPDEETADIDNGLPAKLSRKRKRPIQEDSEDELVGSQLKGLGWERSKSDKLQSVYNNCEVIDLTQDDPPSPPYLPSHPERRLAKRPRVAADKESETDDAESVVRATEDKDKRKILSPSISPSGPKSLLEKLLNEEDPDMQQDIYDFLKQFNTKRSVDDFHNTIMSVINQINSKKIMGIPGMSSRDVKLYKRVAHLYICFTNNKAMAEKVHLEDSIKDTLCQSLRFQNFFRNLTTELSLRFGVEGDEPQEAEQEKILLLDTKSVKPWDKGRQSKKSRDEFTFHEIESDYEVSSRKRKRKHIIEDTSAKQNRTEQNKFLAARFARIRRAEKKKKAIGKEDDGRIAINHGKYASEDDIYIHPEIAASLKPHQVNGIRFLWQELVQSHRGMGALLAHVMGMGKTLQIIAFLHTLAVAAKSKRQNTLKQIPDHLRESRTLIITPSGLVGNWEDEFNIWIPVDPEARSLDLKELGQIIKIVQEMKLNERLAQMQAWHKEGGVLLIGYPMLRDLIKNSGKKLTDNEHQNVRKILLDGPNIIVADEAHEMKNPASNISQVARQFRSKSRIAMTGSPLANCLMEYWSLIDWIDPNYLGPQSEFKLKYISTIYSGLYQDSHTAERRASLKYLHILKTELDPKVHRANISEIQKDLTPKTEFVIVLPLTSLQSELYTRLTNEDKVQERYSLFDFVHLCTLINCHPSAFIRTLGRREEKIREVAKKRDEITKENGENSISPPPDVDLDCVEPPVVETVTRDWAKETATRVLNIDDTQYSYRVEAVWVLLQGAKEARDKVLLFSQLLAVLDFLEEKMKQWGIKYQRLDGSTPASKRQQATKIFNSSKGADVYLISTKAGGLGLNLFGANRVIIFDYTWNPMWEEQAIGRAYRMGQTKQVYVYRFHAGGTYEELMSNKVLFKLQLASRVVDKKDLIRSANRQHAAYYKPPRPIEKASDLNSFVGKDPVLDKLLTKGYIYGVKLTDSLLADEEDKLTEEEQRDAEMIMKQNQANRQMMSVNTPKKSIDLGISNSIPQPDLVPSGNSHSLTQLIAATPVATSNIPVFAATSSSGGSHIQSKRAKRVPFEISDEEDEDESPLPNKAPLIRATLSDITPLRLRAASSPDTKHSPSRIQSSKKRSRISEPNSSVSSNLGPSARNISPKSSTSADSKLKEGPLRKPVPATTAFNINGNHLLKSPTDFAATNVPTAPAPYSFPHPSYPSLDWLLGRVLNTPRPKEREKYGGKTNESGQVAYDNTPTRLTDIASQHTLVRSGIQGKEKENPKTQGAELPDIDSIVTWPAKRPKRLLPLDPGANHRKIVREKMKQSRREEAGSKSSSPGIGKWGTDSGTIKKHVSETGENSDASSNSHLDDIVTGDLSDDETE